MGDPRELGEDVELDLEVRRYVLDVFARLTTLGHYELLGVAREAELQVIRRAYFQLARLVHPDRYFGKKLGSYKAKLVAIFAHMTTAYETLSVAERRAAYDATLAPPGKASAPAPVDPAIAAKRQAALAALEQSLAQARAKAEQHAQAAARALAAGNLTSAAASFQQALRMAPNDAGLAARAAEVDRQVAARRLEASRRQAALEEQHGHWPQAAASWRRVVEAAPDDKEARTRLAHAETRAAERRGS